ncbi:MAG: 23S rRNA (guanosine(2251)-2'-O)-methyltransferase RlmB [Bacteroidales bacterium]|jgi:23S rRNA (guanosine2251-2'-O)-methyltransferase|nr:23S rRNA (guanosine(2251)-2'-O)-methyltransferase RlmB [Bacteroidales bacterium]
MKENTDYIFGIRAIIEAIKSGRTIEKLLVKKELQGELFQELSSLARKENIPMQYVPYQKINKITRKNHQGVIAYISPIEFQDIENILPGLFEQGKNPLLLILDQISDVRNFGAITRTAECANINAIIVPTKGSAQISSDAIKTSAGALLKIPVCRTDKLQETVKQLAASGIQIVAASEKSEELYSDIDYSKPTAIVMGSEDRGVSSEILKISDHLAKIPILGEIDSLNVSVASSVIMYEAVRQRLLL